MRERIKSGEREREEIKGGERGTAHAQSRGPMA